MLTETERAVLARLRDDHPFHAETAVRIVYNQKLVPFQLRPAQQRLWTTLKEQREKGEPGRVIILKARKLGFSTQAQAMFFQRVTTRENHTALTVAHRSDTAQELIRMSELMYANVPEELRPWLAPELTNTRKSREMHFGGLNSKILVDTARELSSGRGFTYHSLHLSEVAFWPDMKTKMTTLMNAVPHDDPDTLIIVESTAFGYNYFRELWVKALEGSNDFIPFFVPWHEEARYARRFLSEEQRETFREIVGDGPYGEDEPHLLDEGLTLEQLHWRRWAIENLSGGDLQDFQQEYPATWEEAFATSGRNVFAPALVREARKRAELTDPDAELITLEKTRTVLKRGRFVTVEVPTEFAERPLKDRRTDLYWKVWDRPREKGQYVVVVDPAAGEERTEGESDYTAIQVLDHITRVQVAEMRTHADPDVVAEQAYLICLMYTVRPNRPLLVVEMTGGYGTLIADRCFKEYGHRNMYARKPVDPRRREHHTDLIGFSTDRHTKPRLIDGMRELLRERSHGIRSLQLVSELETYQRTKTGKLEAADGAFDDLLMAYAISQYVAQERPPRPDRSPGSVVSMASRAIRNPVTGY